MNAGRKVKEIRRRGHLEHAQVRTANVDLEKSAEQALVHAKGRQDGLRSSLNDSWKGRSP